MPHRHGPSRKTSEIRAVASPLRIIGGQLRGRIIPYNGDPGLRPMKDRVRESLFNLVGPSVRDKFVIDLFGGTGAVSFEALSRGAHSACIVERRFPNVRVINETAAQLGLADRVTTVAGDAFRWVEQRRPQPERPWLVFCCPPYDLYVTRREDMIRLLATVLSAAAPGSVLAVESDDRFNTAELPQAEQWDTRRYPPAVLSLARKVGV